VGQCGFDHRKIAGFLHRSFGAETIAVATVRDAIKVVRRDSFRLVLVNRVIDADGAPGLELIQTLKAQDDPAISGIPVMLVSDYPDARRRAEELGALPGFGKSDLYTPPGDLIARIRSVLG
jgi:DNA-binding NarL/FixJ family response regulator